MLFIAIGFGRWWEPSRCQPCFLRPSRRLSYFGTQDLLIPHCVFEMRSGELKSILPPCFVVSKHWCFSVVSQFSLFTSDLYLAWRWAHTRTWGSFWPVAGGKWRSWHSPLSGRLYSKVCGVSLLFQMMDKRLIIDSLGNVIFLNAWSELVK